MLSPAKIGHSLMIFNDCDKHTLNLMFTPLQPFLHRKAVVFAEDTEMNSNKLCLASGNIRFIRIVS